MRSLHPWPLPLHPFNRPLQILDLLQNHINFHFISVLLLQLLLPLFRTIRISNLVIEYRSLPALKKSLLLQNFLDNIVARSIQNSRILPLRIDFILQYLRFHLPENNFKMNRLLVHLVSDVSLLLYLFL